MSTLDLARPADSSESEDDDYVPSAEESDASEAENEAHSSCEEAEAKKRKRKGSKSNKPRKRKGGLPLEEEEAADEAAPQPDSTVDIDELSPEEEKKKADQLWADFLRDVEPVPKRKTVPLFHPPAVPNDLPSSSGTSSQAGPPTEKKVKVIEEMQFAGEIVKVEKEVPADSKEAAAQSKPPGPAGKPRRGVEGLLNELFNKKKKLSTLEKSKLDWENYKKAHGIAEDQYFFLYGRCQSAAWPRRCHLILMNWWSRS